MSDIEYARPSTVEEACSLLERHGEGARIIAGGVALSILLKQRLVEPEILVDIEGITALKKISDDANGFRIGALCTHREIEKNLLLREKLPCLSRMAQHIGCVQVRNAGTVGGSLCHADPASDLSPLLIVMGAKVKLFSSQGEREMLLEDFFTDYYQTALDEGEILTEIHLPSPPANSGASYLKYVMREGDMAMVGAAAMVTLDNEKEKCIEAGIVLGAAGPTPMRAKEAEEALRGGAVNESSLRDAAAAAIEASQPLPDSSGSEQYKREMVGVMTRRAISQALQTAS